MTDFNFKQKKAKVKAVNELMTQLVDETNTMGMDEAVAEGIATALQGAHRTLQNSFMRTFTLAMRDYANTRTDARNAGAVDAAKRISELQLDLPFI